MCSHEVTSTTFRCNLLNQLNNKVPRQDSDGDTTSKRSKSRPTNERGPTKERGKYQYFGLHVDKIEFVV